jgi:hypothetical protein
MLRFPPQVFRQANLEGFTQIIREIRKWMNPRGNENGRAGKCVELYGGVGTIGLNVLDLVEELWCSDANPFNEKCFTQSRDALSPSDAARASYSTGGAADMALAGELAGPVDVLIVDPPRKGLDEEVLEKLISGEADPPLRILYVSCGFKAFGRDYQRLSSRYKVVHAEGHVLFPGSNHIETLCVFDRKDFVGTGRSHEMPTAMRSSSNSLSAGASSNSHQSSQYDTADRTLFSNNSKNLKNQETMRKKLKKKKPKKKKRRRN